MSNVTVTWSTAEFTRGLAQTGRRVNDDVNSAAGESARRIQAGAQARVKVRTGRTRASITIVRGARGFRVEAQTPPGMHPLVPVWIEYGTVRSAPAPFLGPATDAEREPFHCAAAAAVDAALRDGGR